MRSRLLVLIALPLALAGAAADAQTARTPWGAPDLQGTWSNATLTPLQRPADLKDKEFFTPDEAKAYVRQRLAAAERRSRTSKRTRRAGNVGSYNDAWMDRGNDIVPTRRTSLIVDPKNGRVPPFTPDAQRQFDRDRRTRRRIPPTRPKIATSRSGASCFGGGHAPMLPEPYNNNYYIVQTPDYVTIMAELNHEVRIIPIDGRAHLPGRVTQWVGDSRGHWEGDTLVVETTNQKPNRHYLRRPDARFSDERQVQSRRAIHAHGARSDPLQRDGVRPRVHGAVDGRGLHASAEPGRWSSTRATRATTGCAGCCRRLARKSASGGGQTMNDKAFETPARRGALERSGSRWPAPSPHITRSLRSSTRNSRSRCAATISRVEWINPHAFIHLDVKRRRRHRREAG